jgi:starch phosphorylase
MVQNYAEQLYLPALKRARALGADKLAKSVALAHEKDRLRANWGRMHIDDVSADTSKPKSVNEKLEIKVTANLGEIRHEEVRVQLYVGPMDNDGRIPAGAPTDLVHLEDLHDGRHRFGGAITAPTSGRYGFAVRIIPAGEMFEGVTEPGLILWDKIGSPVAAPTVRVAERVG